MQVIFQVLDIIGVKLVTRGHELTQTQPSVDKSYVRTLETHTLKSLIYVDTFSTVDTCPTRVQTPRKKSLRPFRGGATKICGLTTYDMLYYKLIGLSNEPYLEHFRCGDETRQRRRQGGCDYTSDHQRRPPRHQLHHLQIQNDSFYYKLTTAYYK